MSNETELYDAFKNVFIINWKLEVHNLKVNTDDNELSTGDILYCCNKVCTDMKNEIDSFMCKLYDECADEIKDWINKGSE